MSSLKALARLLLGPRLTGWAGTRWVWSKTLANYLLMRWVPARLLRVRAWPHSLYLEGTNICNAACVFCAYPQMIRPKTVMTLELFRSVVDQYLAMGGDEVDLTPIVGDPFADGKLFERLDAVAARPKVRRFHFFTNAIGMRPELGEKLLGYGARLTVYISFGGFDRETYRKVFGADKFDAVTANVRALIEAKRRTGAALAIQINLRTPKGNNSGEFWEYLLEAKRQGLIELTWMGAFDSWAGRIADDTLRQAGLEPRPMRHRDRIKHLVFKLLKQHGQILFMLALGQIWVHAAVRRVEHRLAKQRRFFCFKYKTSGSFCTLH